MEAANVEASERFHVVAMPYPGRGHINPMMNMCKLLALSDHRLTITFVVTEEWLGLMCSAPEQPQIRFRSIPNVVPSERVRGANFAGFVKAVFTKMEEPFERLLERLERKPSCIIADTYLPWAVEVGKRWNIAVASLWTMSPTMFCILHTLNRHSSLLFLAERGDGRVNHIPGISSFRLADLPLAPAPEDEAVLTIVRESFSWVTKAQCLLFSCSYELEDNTIDSLKAEIQIPVYPIGPSIPLLSLQEGPPKSMDHTQVGYKSWLDSKPRSSVLYVSLGSFLPVSGEQMDEIAAGLRASGVYFLWIARGDAARLQEMSGEMGVVVPWCDQLYVLCHPSVGGFLTHCGWNSTMEGVYAGVLMLTFPLIWDQFPNAKLIVEDWKVGMRLRDKVEEENVVQKQKIAEAVKKLMDLDGDESKEMRRRAEELSATCNRAVEKGGSSHSNIQAFVSEFVHS